MARNFKNSIIVRKLHEFPTVDWLAIMDSVEWAVASAAEGEVDTVPGPMPGEVDWLFELESDASWFLLKHGGRIVDPNEVSLRSLMVSFG